MASDTGVSLVICAHNSAARIAAVLEHLARQEAPGLDWEVLLVDNVCIDETLDIARRVWPSSSRAPLRVVRENRLGLAHARRTGIEQARYECICFVDDDNWLAPDWVRTAEGLMRERPEVGAFGGRAEAVSEGPFPTWFDRFQQNYAVGPQAEGAGDVTWSRGYLWGAGLTLRRSAVMGLLRSGFRPLLAGRTGTELSAGDDGEWCLALRLAGWKLRYEPRLKLKHYLPQARLQWSYLKRLWRGFGRANVILDLYGQFARLPGRPNASFAWLRMAVADFLLAWWVYNPFRRLLNPKPYSWDEILHVYHNARMLELLMWNVRYDRVRQSLTRAKWVTVAGSGSACSKAGGSAS